MNSSSVASVGSLASRCRSCPHERDGVTAKRQKECAFSTTEDHFSWHGIGLNIDAGAPVTGSPSIESILSAVKSIRQDQSLTVRQFQRLLGLMAAAANMIPFGLLYMRPLQWWLRTKGFSPKGNPFRMIKVMRRCLRALIMWKKPWLLSQGPMLGASCRRKMLTTDASLTGWGAILEGHSSQGLWKDHHLSWRINRLEMLAVFLALKSFLADLRGHHVLVHSDNTSVVSYINHHKS